MDHKTEANVCNGSKADVSDFTVLQALSCALSSEMQSPASVEEPFTMPVHSRIRVSVRTLGTFEARPHVCQCEDR